jgi:hypothetical protein
LTVAKLHIPTRIRSQFSDRAATFTWGGGDIDYAHKVHTLRPWTGIAMAQTDIAGIVAEEFNATGELATSFDRAMIEMGDRFVETIDDYDFALPSRNEKKYRSGRTYGRITDSGDLRDSMRMQIS